MFWNLSVFAFLNIKSCSKQYCFVTRKGYFYPANGGANALPMGFTAFTWQSFRLYSFGERELGFKNTDVNRHSSKCPKPLLSGWMSGLVGGYKKVIQFSSNSGEVKSKMSLYQIWHWKLSTNFRSKFRAIYVRKFENLIQIYRSENS